MIQDDQKTHISYNFNNNMNLSQLQMLEMVNNIKCHNEYNQKRN
jgi:hypothetical protein